MKKLSLVGILLSVIFLCTCTQNDYHLDDDNYHLPGGSGPHWEYTNYIYIDYTIEACEVDSCAHKLPWLRGKIEQAIADTVGLRDLDYENMDERDICTRLDILISTDNTTGEIYFIEDDSFNNIKNIYNCNGEIQTSNPNYSDFEQFLHAIDESSMMIVGIYIGWEFVPGNV